jgi:hypothetical protein
MGMEINRRLRGFTPIREREIRNQMPEQIGIGRKINCRAAILTRLLLL